MSVVPPMHLTHPTKKYEQSWESLLHEFDENEEWSGFWNVPQRPTDLDEYIKVTKDYSKGKNLPDYWVTADTYWLIDNNQIVGHVNVRHKLSDNLKKRGGHIGYAIRPSVRKKGYGTKILQLALLKAKKLGLKEVLITCDDANTASQKIIERNKGVLQDIIEVDGKKVRRYIISL
ncbi:GNAT family N-acetyltransferase [Patescibacteria group bacterium]|nr:GNAT family N-acetyltransferase [Patescibacteria group bacterium]